MSNDHSDDLLASSDKSDSGYQRLSQNATREMKETGLVLPLSLKDRQSNGVEVEGTYEYEDPGPTTQRAQFKPNHPPGIEVVGNGDKWTGRFSSLSTLKKVNAMESLLKETGSCGHFQTLFILCACFPTVLFAIFMLFMSFGNYNPGWRCLDNTTELQNFTLENGSLPMINDTLLPYTTGNCDLHESCSNVEYNTEASTVITEWNLACGRSWISAAITSSQMIGVLIGAFFTGYLGDRFGRKHTLMGALLVNVILNLLTVFTISWPMFVVVKILSGVCNSTFRFLPFVYCTEFVSSKWRVAVASFPFYGVGAIIFAILAMITKDWRQIHIILACSSALCFIIMLWLPRSIRWLVTHNKWKEAFKAAKTIAKLNGRPTPAESTINLIPTLNDASTENKKHTIKQLFRKGVKVYTFMIGFLYSTIGLTYYVISFGVKSLPGNLYTNLILISALALVANASAIFAGNRLSRRKSYLVFAVIVTLSLLGVVITIFAAPEKTESMGILVLALIARSSGAAVWYITTTIMNELFPTVIRSSISGWANLCAQTGASVAPFLVPKEKDLMYVSYIVMAFLNLLCTLFFFLFPETAGIQLKDTWDETDSGPESEKIKSKTDDETNDGLTKMTSNVELTESQLSPMYTNI